MNFKRVSLVLVVGFIIFIIYKGISVFVLNKNYGYHKITFINRLKALNIFNDSIKDIIKIESAANNNDNDTFYSLSYRNEFKVIYWSIGQYKSLPSTFFNYQSINSIKKEDGVYYLLIGNSGPIIDIRARISLPVNLPISYSFNNINSVPELISNSPHYKFYRTDSKSIYFYSNQQFYDIQINRVDNNEIGFLLLPTKFSLKILMIVPIGNFPVDSNLLNRVLKEKINKK